MSRDVALAALVPCASPRPPRGARSAAPGRPAGTAPPRDQARAASRATWRARGLRDTGGGSERPRPRRAARSAHSGTAPSPTTRQPGGSRAASSLDRDHALGQPACRAAAREARRVDLAAPRVEHAPRPGAGPGRVRARAPRASAPRPRAAPCRTRAPSRVATPIRSPVNEPGPIDTAKPSTAASATPASREQRVERGQQRLGGGAARVRGALAEQRVAAPAARRSALRWPSRRPAAAERGLTRSRASRADATSWRERSFQNARPISSSSTVSPSCCDDLARAQRERRRAACPRSRRSRAWPPSSIGIGSRFRMPRLMLMNTRIER